MAGFLNSFSPIIAGSSGTTAIQFILPPGTDASLGSVTFKLQDSDGLVYSSGSAIGYSISVAPHAVQVNGSIILMIPDNIPVNPTGTAYQVSMVLSIPGVSPIFQNALVTVLPNTMVSTGAADTVIVRGNSAKLNLVLPTLPGYVTANFYKDNDIINASPPAVQGPVVTSDGYSYTIVLDTTQIPASLEPYGVIWLIGDDPITLHDQEQSAVYIISPTQVQAAKDLMLRINKARTSIGDRPTFEITEMFSYLRRGMDWFNSIGAATNFNMTNAKYGTREFWIKFSEVVALRAQYMFEGETSFDFQGQAISLSVDRSQFYDGLASTIESEAVEATRVFKQQMAKRGNSGGDGSANPTSLQHGAIGSVGISLSPVSNLRLGNPNSYFFGIRPFW